MGLDNASLAELENPLKLSSIFLALKYPTDLEARKQIYQECTIRRAVIKKPGWNDTKWKAESKEQRDHRRDVKLETVAEYLDYKEPAERKESISQRLGRSIVPVEDDHEIFQGVARMELLRRNPDRKEELFRTKDGKPFNPEEYWPKFMKEHDIPGGLPFFHISYLWDTADFGANYFLRVFYLYGETPAHLRDKAELWRAPPSELLGDPTVALARRKKMFDIHENFSTRFSAALKQALLGFKYWLDEPYHATPDLRKASPAVDDVLSAVLPVDVNVSAASVSNYGLVNARRDIALKIKAHKKEPVGDDDKKDETYMYEMTYWSENHQVLFATAEYLAGQLWPNEIFKAGKNFRDEGPDATLPNDLTGKAHMAKAKTRLIRWLNDRLRFGFNEWNSSVYYQEDFNALFNLADFCLDPEIQVRACMVLDLLFFDLGRFSHNGSFGVTAGRNYSDQKMSGWEQSIADLSEIVFGHHHGLYVSGGGGVDGSFASLRRYKVPDVLIAVGQDKPSHMIDRSRVSITFQEAGEYGIGFEKEEDVLFWWAKSAYFIKQLMKSSQRVAEVHHLMNTPPFKEVLPALGAVGWGLSVTKLMGYAAAGAFAPVLIPVLGNPFSQKDEAADALSVITEGSSLTRANLYTFKNKAVMLSSVQNYRPGQYSFQGHFCQATINMTACVWTTHPSAGGGIDKGVVQGVKGIAGAYLGGAVGSALGGGLLGPALGGSVGLLGAVAGVFGSTQTESKDIIFLKANGDGPNWWTGSVTIPRVVQYQHAAILAYNPNEFQIALFGSRTHAWFPRQAFENVIGPVESLNCNVDSGRWIFGKAGDGYVGLYSGQTPEWTTEGDWKDKELIAEGKRNIFILQVGDAELFTSFENFVDRVQRARIHINGLHWGPADFQCSYDIPGLRRLELHYEEEDAVRLHGQPFDDFHFPRYENSYISGGRVLWGQYAYTIKHKSLILTHDFSSLRKVNHPTGMVERHVNSVEHTPRLIEQLMCSPQTSLSGRGSTDRPALSAAMGNINFTSASTHLYMAWKGVEDDSALYWATWNGGAWSAQRRIDGVGSSQGPALAHYPMADGVSGLLMAWKGTEDDSAIYFSINQSLSSDGWLPQTRIVGIGTSTHPALTTFNGNIVMAWKGVDDDSGIYYSTYKGNQWVAQKKIDGIGSSDSPSMVVCNDKLYMFWKGIADDSNLYYSTMEETSGNWAPQTVIAYKNITGQKLHKIGSSHAPAVTCLNNIILLAWKGVDGDNNLYLSTWEDDEWVAQVKIKGIGSSLGPSLMALDKKIFMCWKGTDDDDHQLYQVTMGANIPEGSGIYFSWAE